MRKIIIFPLIFMMLCGCSEQKQISDTRENITESGTDAYESPETQTEMSDISESVNSYIEQLLEENGSIDLSKIRLGMSNSEVREIIPAQWEDESSSPLYVYDNCKAGSDNFSGSDIYLYKFTYGDGMHLDTIQIIPGLLNDFSEMYDDFYSSVNDLYGLSDDDWEWESEYRAYAEYDEGDSKLYLKLGIYTSGGSDSVTLDIFNLDYRSFNDVPNIPVIP
ncbi:MAG: hypothetical protein K2N72_07385 [Oscillospiraceae bacterium]|nr:hypothetical protein [Oscillospiraceae bacterium]